MIPDFKTAKARSNWIATNADLWTVVCFHGYGRYERHEFKDQQNAEAAARRLATQSGKCYMIYACSGIHDTWFENIYPEETNASAPREHPSLQLRPGQR